MSVVEGAAWVPGRPRWCTQVGDGVTRASVGLPSSHGQGQVGRGGCRRLAEHVGANRGHRGLREAAW